ncbi:alpha/beta fold hydrolase [Paractinoplanes durhamensis]|uniref:Hydrolase n=1 Tax=Paractinoplanes durhamensis TaxID=113563 RepID=A0ABQ3YW63_9ACTN|nr:alpha/beta fold hydrolase [Actinoplanes durhamensis]GIE01833.1 hydrolase [Actinoplanes durhamensis]
MKYHRQGSGSPIVLIHGIGSRWQVWKPVLDRLAEWHDVIALDLPGFGESPFDGVPGSVPNLADRVAAFLGELGVDRPAFGGSSLGGGVALELARRGQARSVVAFSPVGFFGTAEAAWCRAVVTAARAGGSALRPALPRLFGTRAGRVALAGVFYGRPGALPPDECLADARALIAAPGFTAARRELGEWRLTDPITDVPLTIAWGDRDLVLPYRQAGRARRLLPHARHVRLPGCGHLPFADDPQTCTRLLLEAA